MEVKRERIGEEVRINKGYEKLWKYIKNLIN